MRQFRRNFLILGIGVVLVSSSFTMIIPFLSVYLIELGAEERWLDLWAGAIFSSFYLAGAVVGPVWGALADKYGRKKMVVRAGICLAAIYCLIAVVRSPGELLAVRLLHGIVGGFVPASFSIVAAGAPKEKMGYYLGLMEASVAVGQVMGPLIGGLLYEWAGMRLSALIPAALLMCATIAVVVWVKEEKPAGEAAERSRTGDDKDLGIDKSAEKSGESGAARRHEKGAAKSSANSAGETIFSALRQPVLISMFLLLFMFHFAFNLLQPILPLYIAELRGRLEGAVISSGLVISLVGLATIIAAPRWGIAGSRYGYERVMTLCFVAAGALGIALYVPHTIPGFAFVYFTFGLFVSGIVPSINTIAAQNTGRRFRGRLFGMTKSASHLGAMTGGFCGGLLASWLGMANVLVICGGILLLVGLFAKFAAEKRKISGNMEGSA